MYKSLAVVCFLFFWFGFVGPWAVSAASDALVVGWYISTAIMVVATIKYAWRKYQGDKK